MIRARFDRPFGRSCSRATASGRRIGGAAGGPVALALAAALLLAGCGGAAHHAGDGHGGGSTLTATWHDPRGTGFLARGPGEPFVNRTDLAPAAPATGRTLATFAQITDAHVTDAESPARVPFLDRLGGAFSSTFRPQETLTTQVLASTVEALDRMPLDAVVETGDLIDNDQQNELSDAVRTLDGGQVVPDSGAGGYDGPQEARDPDPFYYRPDVDPPRHPNLLARATNPFQSPGLTAPWYPVLGNHDVLVQGVLPPSNATQQAALGDRALWEPPHGIAVPQTGGDDVTPDLAGLPPDTVRRLLAQANVHVPPDVRRKELTSNQTVSQLIAGSHHGEQDGDLLQYGFDLGSGAYGIVLDLVDRDGGSTGVVGRTQLEFLRQQLRAAGDRWVVVFTHQPLTSATNGDAALALLDRDPRVVAAIDGDTHRNKITARRSPAGGYWLIETSSLVDYPQQARAFALRQTTQGVELDTWMVDHDSGVGGLARISRSLAYLDAQGGRPAGFAGTAADRNARLFKRAVVPSG